jgi:hypothetical protein
LRTVGRWRSYFSLALVKSAAQNIDHENLNENSNVDACGYDLHFGFRRRETKLQNNRQKLPDE